MNSPPHDLTTGNILIVDDNPDNLRLLVTLLKRQGYTVRPLRDGKTALTAVRSSLPDLILLDVLMPQIDGYEVCRQLKSDERTHAIPVLFITALSDITDKIQGFALGGVDYITKPFQEEEVLARVRTHIKLYQLHRALQEENARFRALEAVAFEGIFLHDHGKILDINAMAVTIFGFLREELQQRHILDCIAPGSQKEAQQWLETPDELPCEFDALKSTGEIFPIQMQSRNVIYQGREISVTAIRDLSHQRQLEQENFSLKHAAQHRYQLGLLVGKSQRMQSVFEQILTAAVSKFSVLISGESGTGKELAARMIHQLGPRSEKSFVAVNCGAIHANLFEREFFGHRKGSFTGADKGGQGLLDAACGGTLFLDEVTELLPEQQVKLLRVLQEGEYIPIGGNQKKSADVRIIAATNQDIKMLLRQGKIREDFFYRIHVIALEVPPLRERKEDLPLLIDHLLEKHEASIRYATLPASIREACYAYHWPGNVRELENELQRYLSTRRLELFDLNSPPDNDLLDYQEGNTLPQAIALLEKRYIRQALERTQLHRGKTAELLGISRRTLYQKIKEFGLDTH